jgi:protein-S-isoprenylcysteine O-methyltransferase Ste14
MIAGSFSIYSWITVILWIAAFAWLAPGVKTANEGVRASDKSTANIAGRIFKVFSIMLMFLVLYVPQWFHLRVPPSNQSAIAGVIGVVLCLAGVLVFVLSRRALGKNWSDLVVLKEGHEVVYRGPYRWVRHPLYTGFVLGLFGSAMTIGTRSAYAVAALVFLGFVVKSRREEEMLSRQLPGYAQYKQQVKRFIPFVF